MKEKLYRVNPEELVRISGKQYIQASNTLRLIDTSKAFILLYFVRDATYEWFPDDPVIGAERWAFRESRIKGPFFSESEASDLKKKISDEIKKHKKYGDFKRDYKSLVSILKVVIPEEDVRNLKPNRFIRYSLRIKIHEIAYEFHRDKFPDLRKRLEDIYDLVSKRIKSGNNFILTPKGGLVSIIQESFCSVEPFFTKPSPKSDEEAIWNNRPRISTNIFCPEGNANPLSTLNSILSSNFIPFEYDTHVSSEEFFSLSSFDISLDHNSIEEILKHGRFVPSKVEKLGKITSVLYDEENDDENNSKED